MKRYIVASKVNTEKEIERIFVPAFNKYINRGKNFGKFNLVKIERSPKYDIRNDEEYGDLDMYSVHLTDGVSFSILAPAHGEPFSKEDIEFNMEDGVGVGIYEYLKDKMEDPAEYIDEYDIPITPNY